MFLSKRQPEPYFTHSPMIAEWYNTWSNLGFVLCGLYGLQFYSTIEAKTMSLCLVLCGLCSMIHHALADYEMFIILDLMPIVISLYYAYQFELVQALSGFEGFCIGAALGLLLMDHAGPLLIPPWGHVLWHLAAAGAAFVSYQALDEYVMDQQAPYWNPQDFCWERGGNFILCLRGKPGTSR